MAKDVFIRNDAGLVVGFVVQAKEDTKALRERFMNWSEERGCIIPGCSDWVGSWGVQPRRGKLIGASNCRKHERCRDLLFSGS